MDQVGNRNITKRCGRNDLLTTNLEQVNVQAAKKFYLENI